MPTPSQLIDRLEAIARSVAGTGQGLALIGLGSVGAELDRLDAYSDLDFFVIVQPGVKRDFLDSLFWLENVAPVVYAFLNTADLLPQFMPGYEDSPIAARAILAFLDIHFGVNPAIKTAILHRC